MLGFNLHDWPVVSDNPLPEIARSFTARQHHEESYMQAHIQLQGSLDYMALCSIDRHDILLADFRIIKRICAGYATMSITDKKLSLELAVDALKLKRSPEFIAELSELLNSLTPQQAVALTESAKRLFALDITEISDTVVDVLAKALEATRDEGERKNIFAAFVSLVTSLREKGFDVSRAVNTVSAMQKDKGLRSEAQRALKDLGDFTIQLVSGDAVITEVKCWSPHLRKNWAYFESLMSSHLKEAQTKLLRLQVDDRDEAATVAGLIEYLNTDEITIDTDNALSLLVIANKYQIAGLVQKCEQIVLGSIDDITLQESATLLEVAELVSSKAIAEKARAMRRQAFLHSIQQLELDQVKQAHHADQALAEILSTASLNQLCILLNAVMRNEEAAAWLLNIMHEQDEFMRSADVDAMPVAPVAQAGNGPPFAHPWHAHALGVDMRDNGWRCDGVLQPGGCRRGITIYNQSQGVPRYRCEQCDFDLCDMCMQIYISNLPKHPYFPNPPPPKKKILSVFAAKPKAGEAVAPEVAIVAVTWDNVLQMSDARAKRLGVVAPTLKFGEEPKASCPLHIALRENLSVVPLILSAFPGWVHVKDADQMPLVIALDRQSAYIDVILREQALSSFLMHDENSYRILNRFVATGTEAGLAALSAHIEVNWRSIEYQSDAPARDNRIIEYSPERDINECLNFAQSPTILHLLCTVRNGVSAVRTLIQRGCDVNALAGVWKKNTPLMVAALNNNVECIRVLLEANANPNLKNSSDWTPLHVAAFKGFPEIVELLMQHGAHDSPAKKFDSLDVPALSNKFTAAQLAERTAERDLIVELLARGRKLPDEGRLFTIEEEWGKKKVKRGFKRLFF